jgi:hypothetical protein
MEKRNGRYCVTGTGQELAQIILEKARDIVGADHAGTAPASSEEDVRPCLCLCREGSQGEIRIISGTVAVAGNTILVFQEPRLLLAVVAVHTGDSAEALPVHAARSPARRLRYSHCEPRSTTLSRARRRNLRRVISL